jgi:hypothetical protein
MGKFFGWLGSAAVVVGPMLPGKWGQLVSVIGAVTLGGSVHSAHNSGPGNNG